MEEKWWNTHVGCEKSSAFVTRCTVSLTVLKVLISGIIGTSRLFICPGKQCHGIHEQHARMIIKFLSKHSFNKYTAIAKNNVNTLEERTLANLQNTFEHIIIKFVLERG